MDALFIKILNMSITASWLIISVMITRLLIRKAPKWISCLLWGFVMIRLICPFSFESSLSVIPSKEVIPQDIALSESPAISTGVSAINRTLNPIIESLAPTVGGSVNPLQVWTAVGTWIWLAGIVVMLAYALISYLKLKKQVAASVPLGDGIMACDEVKSPFILGIFKPTIYIPSDLAGESLEYVLGHEEAHLKRKDHLWKPLGYLLLAVYWFNPLCWAAYVLLSRDIEMACDEKVIRDMDREQTAGYSQALLNASYHVRGVRACPVAFGEVSVKQRVKGVLNYKKPAFWVIVVALVLCVALGVTLLTDPATKNDEQKIPPDVNYVAVETSVVNDEPKETSVGNSEPEEAPAENDEPEAPVSTGTFIKPVDVNITRGFGESSGKMHNGVDFAAEEGTPIVASSGGTVIKAESVDAYGNCVEIDHGDGVVTRYAHCSKLLVSEGDSVSQGQNIAEVGSTGLSTGPHCHFEIIVNGEAVDPVPMMDLEG